MDTTTTKNVMDIPASDRQALEHLLGTPLEPEQRVMIFTYTPGQLPVDETREVARRQIEQMIATNQQLAINAGITAEEADAAIDERLQLPMLLGSFKEDIGKHSSNLSKTTIAAFGGLSSPALGVVWQYHSAVAVFLGLDRDTILPEQECHRLERIIRNTSKIIYDSQIPPNNEAAVRQRVYDILIHVFPDTVREVPICQVTKTYKPDIGIPSLKSGIEYKFADSQDEVKKAIGGLYEDMRGYAGSEDWKRFYAVVYMTNPFFTEEQIKAEFKHVKADDCWIPVLVVGQGSRKRTAAKTKKK